MARAIKRVKGSDFVSFEIGREVLTVKISEIPKETYDRLVIHGLNAKVGDSAASCKTDEERIGAISASIRNLKNGVWNETSSGGTILAEAIARVKKLDVLEAQSIVDGLDDEQLAAVKNHPKVKEAIAQIRTERAKTSAKSAKIEDLDAILGM